MQIKMVATVLEARNTVNAKYVTKVKSKHDVRLTFGRQTS